MAKKKKKRKYQYEILVDSKWHYFKNWDAVWEYTLKNSVQIGRATVIVDMDEMEKKV